MAVDDASPIPLPPGKAPDLSAPLDLPRLVMRRALAVALVGLALSLGLGLVAARLDTRDEIAGALALARAVQRLQSLPADDAAAIETLRALPPARHVRLRVRDEAGRLRFDSEPALPGPVLRWLARGSDAPAGQSVTWPLARGAGRAWSATLDASALSEEREALANLAGFAALLAACSLGMLAAMRWNVRRALRPLHALLGAIARVGHGDLASARALPAMPVRELAAIAEAVRRLAASLGEAEQARRTLAQQVLTLQEDERQRLARDLHDEFGQRLAALRADAAWLQRRVAGDAGLAAVVDGMAAQLAHVHGDVRGLLARLQPLATSGGGHGVDGTPRSPTSSESAARLAELLDTLAHSWSRPGDHGLACTARVTLAGALGARAPADVRLPRDVVLALYRISQEALTNAARHGAARSARVEVAIEPGRDDPAHPGGLVVRWSARDDGQGLREPAGALARGNGLAGMKERVWALGGEFEWTAADAPPLPGLHLRARLACAEAAS